jgi:hypothetical protein
MAFVPWFSVAFLMLSYLFAIQLDIHLAQSRPGINSL